MKNKTIVSTGLICLDIIQQEQGYWLMAGGSAINPLMIVNNWGWEVFPIGRIGSGQSANEIIQDCKHFGINTSLLFVDETIQTPMYLMTMNKGRHIFHKKCPVCQIPYPKFSPLTGEMMNQVIHQLPKHVNVCLIERISKSALRLVEECKHRGALVMFEPNRIEEEELLDPMLAVTDILKYSNERIPLLTGIEERTANHPVSIEMQTQGRDGIRFRCLQTEHPKWVKMPAVQCEKFIDAAGAGDWTTARFLHELMSKNDLNSALCDVEIIKQITHQAQQEAANNCAFPAPRSQMYETRRNISDRLPCSYCKK